jgi:hypothetical protein
MLQLLRCAAVLQGELCSTWRETFKMREFFVFIGTGRDFEILGQ